MTQREYVEYVLREWQIRLNLAHWNIKIKWDELIPEDQKAEAEITMADDYESATLRLSDTYETWSEHWTNGTIVHELMHVVTRGLQVGFESAEIVMPTSAWKMFQDRMTHEMEGVVDKTALLMVEMAGVVTSPAREETTYVFHAAA